MAVLCQSFFVKVSVHNLWTGFLDIAKGSRVSGFGGFGISYLISSLVFADYVQYNTIYFIVPSGKSHQQTEDSSLPGGSFLLTLGYWFS